MSNVTPCKQNARYMVLIVWASNPRDVGRFHAIHGNVSDARQAEYFTWAQAIRHVRQMPGAVIVGRVD